MTEEFTYPTLRHPRKVFSRIGLSLFLYFVVVNLSSLVFTFVSARFLPVFYNSGYFVWANMVLCQYVIGVPTIRLTMIGLPTYKYSKEKMRFGELLSAYVICQALSYAGSFIGNALNQGISAALGKEIENTVGDLISSSNIIVLFLVVGIIGPIMEELVFRKFIIDRIRPYGEVLAVLFSGITFGMFHGNFYQFFYACALGTVFAFIYIRTKNILYTIILHCAFNTTSVLGQAFLNGSEDLTLSKTANQLFMVAYYALSAALIAFTVLGIIKFIKSIKKVYFIKNIYAIPKNKAFLYSCINVGMILFSVTVLVEFVMSIFF